MVKKIMPFSSQKFDLNGKEGKTLKKELTIKAKILLGAIIMLLILIVIVIGVSVFGVELSKESYFPEAISSSKLGTYKQAAVSTDAAQCAPIGRLILEKNGSAVDSAIAMLLCMGVVNPQSQGLGGGFLMTIYNKEKGEVLSLDAREQAPLRAFEDMFKGNASLSVMGGLSIAVPGELSGYAAAHRRFGKLPWRELFIPTIKMCHNGIPVTKHLAKNLILYGDEIRKREPFKKLFTNNQTGELLTEGEIMRRPDLALTLEVLSNDGEEALYNSSHPLAARFLQDLRKIGTIITEEDLNSYQPRFSSPIITKLNDNSTVYSAAIPGSGILLSFIINILEGYNMTSQLTKTQEDSTLAVHRIIEALKFAYAKRMFLDDDEEVMKPLIQQLSSAEYAREIRHRINDSSTSDDLSYYGLIISSIGKEDHGTSHTTVRAPNGDVVTVTSTINTYFGSFEISESTGIILNNEMDDFSIPDVVSFFDVPPSQFNRIKPKKRPISSMCPTIVVGEDGNVKLALGGNGGTKITTAVLQVLLRNLWLDENIKTAIDAPRFHHQLLPNIVQHELNFPKAIIEGLKQKGHKIEEITKGMLGIVMGITRGEDGLIYANADYRKAGEVDGF